ncbi:hypothetical protein JZ751_018578 [Albula glossodonta]|uniref:Protein FAM53B n=1 Tax=Albula glossodonta TaxID=121402 RepID=A0A8T2NP56_9TELE|nr:hypothetical protein JZ751_018578 [Albula glossodonta]
MAGQKRSPDACSHARSLVTLASGIRKRVKSIPGGPKGVLKPTLLSPCAISNYGSPCLLSALEWTGPKMCITMVIICSKTLEKKKVVDDVTSRESKSELRKPQTMSKGTTLFTCGTVETDRWRDLGRSCAGQQGGPGASLDRLWDVLPGVCQRGGVWGREAGTGAASAIAITSLIRDLSLSDSKAMEGPAPSPSHSISLSTAPPTKRQCRSLSFSDELGGCRSPWRPASSRVWAPVEKRRCHSGGSVQRGGIGGLSTTMQRSSSFSLPARANTLALPLGVELPCLAQRLPCLYFTAFQPSEPPTQQPPRPLSLSQEQIGSPSAASSPESTPELGRRVCPCPCPGGLARSRSQPCKLRNFQSLSCPGITGADCCQSSHAPLTYSGSSQSEAAYTSSCVLGVGLQPRPKEDGEDSSCEELDSEDFAPGTSKGDEENEDPWEGSSGTEKDVNQLGGELDIEQIERN